MDDWGGPEQCSVSRNEPLIHVIICVNQASKPRTDNTASTISASVT